MATVEKIQDPMPNGNTGYRTTALSLAFTFLSDLGNDTQPYENAAGIQHEGLRGWGGGEGTIQVTRQILILPPCGYFTMLISQISM